MGSIIDYLLFDKLEKPDLLSILEICMPMLLSVILTLGGITEFAPEYEAILDCLYLLLISLALNTCFIIGVLVFGMYINRYISFWLIITNAALSTSSWYIYMAYRYL